MNTRHGSFPTAAALGSLLLMNTAQAAGEVGEAAKQATNWTAIIMFVIFVCATL